jgi:hypothetical protein
MKNNFRFLFMMVAVMVGLPAALSGASITAIGLLADYVPSSNGGVANCSSSGLNAISPDGQIAVGYVYGDIYWDGTVYESGQDIAIYWSKTTGLVRRNDDWRHGPWTGIGGGTGTPGPTYPAIVVGNLSDIGHYVGPPLGQDTPGYDASPGLVPISDCLVAAQNCVSGNGRYVAGEHTKSQNALRWDTNDLANPMYALGIGETWFTGVANDGACVGTDRHGVGATTKGAIYWTESGGVQDIPPLTGNTTTSGEGRGISDNGAYVTGLMYTDSGTPLYEAFRWSPGDTSSAVLPPAGSDTLSWATDVADNGTAVGWSYNTTDSNRACVWDAAGQPHLLWDLLLAAGVDMSGWTKLTMAYSITPDGNYIAGYGRTASGQTQGFVAETPQVPKPSLGILLAGANVIISWPTNATGYALQQNSNLTTTVWTAVTNTPNVADTNMTVTIPVLDGNRFYRLIK